jgi:hypothetical protein
VTLAVLFDSFPWDADRHKALVEKAQVCAIRRVYELSGPTAVHSAAR